MRLFLITITLLTCFACKADTLTTLTSTGSTHRSDLSKKAIKSLDELRLKKDLDKSYSLVKKSIEKSRKNIKFDVKEIESISKKFKESLLNRIIPFWEGTEWSFTGHTNKPKEGEIACGYFISTTLQDIGLNVNKFKLAQQSPINEAKSLALNSKIIEIEEGSNTKNIEKINKKLAEGIHFIGFDDGHVGYILKENGNLYLIHSNYIMSKGVEIKKIENSEVFSSFDKFYIVELSTNKELLKKWLKGRKIKVIKGSRFNVLNLSGLNMFPKLKYIEFFDSKISFNNEKWLSKIEVFIVGKTIIKGLRSFKTMPELKKIYMAFSKFETFPKNLDKLTCLQEINLGAHMGKVDLNKLNLSKNKYLKKAEFTTWYNTFSGIPTGVLKSNIKEFKVEHKQLTKKDKKELRKIKRYLKNKK